MAHIVEITNPFEPFKDTRVTDHPGGISVRAWLQERFPGFLEFDRPTIITVNGHPLLRKDWGRTIQRDDVINIITMAGWPVVFVIVALIAVAAIVLVLSIKPITPGQTSEADPVYSLKGQRNQIRLGEPIEVPYGRVRMWPSFAAMSYNKYQNNEQWLYQLFCLGQGSYVIEEVNIEDTPIANFSDVTYEIYPPGVPVTLFPDNVVTSAEVRNIELFGPNEPESGSGGTVVVDSPGDVGLGFPATDHTGYSPGGSTPAFVANPTLTQTNLIELDVSFPRGLYLQQDDGGLANKTVTATFQARLIDDSGTPIGSWFTINSFSKTLATVTPQRFTLECTVALGRYQVRGYRTNDKDTSSKAGNTVIWEGLRTFLPNTSNYGEVTLMAVKARASNNLNDNSANKINLVGVRKLPYWADGSWQAETPTRNIVWAFCDVFRNQIYGGRLPDSYVGDMTELAALAEFFDDREEYCDWIFDQRLTIWEAAKLIANLGRAIPMLNGSRVTMVRNEPKTLPVVIFNQENIVEGTFNHEIKLNNFDAFDGIEVEYTDANTWKSETVICLLSGDAGDNLEKIKLHGATGRTHAYRWGMWKRGLTRYQNEQVNFSTGMEGHIPSYGDAIGVNHDVLKEGSGGFVTAVDVTNTILTLSEPVDFKSNPTAKLAMKRRNGQTSPIYTVSPGVDENHVVLSSALDPSIFNFADGEPPLFNFGLVSTAMKLCVLGNMSPGSDKTVALSAAVYRPEPHSYDSMTPPALGGTSGNLPSRPALPSVTGFIVTKSPSIPNEVIATWNATRGASYYVLQLSYDGTSWERVSDSIEGTTFRFTVLPKYIYVRIAAVTTGAGPWVYWVGNAPVVNTNILIEEDTPPDPVTAVSVTAGFGMLWLKWTDPTNLAIKKLKAIHVYVTEGSAAGWDTQPASPSFSIPPGQGFFAYSGLADNVRKNFWLKVETQFGLFSSVVGPVSGTTVNGITLSHLIPGGLQPVELVSVLPSTGNYQGRNVFLTVDDNVGGTFPKNKLYRWTGLGTYASPVTGKASWETTVPAVDITGQLTDAQLAAIASTKITGQLTDAQIAAIAAAKVTGQLSDSQLAAIAAAKITGQLVNAQLAAIDATKITGTIADAQLAGIAASKITGTLTNSQIADLDAAKLTGTIVATSVADNSITTPKLFAGAVTAAKIAADTITANEIAAGAITTSELSAGSITAAKIAAGTITASEIAAGAITTAKLAAGSVTATEIAANAIVAGKIAAGSIVAADIAADTITAAQIAANAITATELAAGSVSTAKLVAGAVTAGEIAAGAVTTAKLAAGAVTANELAANTITAAKIAAGAITATELAAGSVTTSKLAAGAVTANELAADSVIAGKIQAGAIVAAAIGTNEIIALAANIKDGIITNAKIASLDAAKINAGTLNTMTLTAAKTGSDTVVFNTADTSRTMQAYCSKSGEYVTSHSLNGTEYISLITVNGWSVGATGLVQNRFGKSTMVFSGQFYSSFSLASNTHFADVWAVYKINSGSWIRMAVSARNHFYGGGGATSIGSVEISGLSGTDVLQFGVELETPAAETFQYAAGTVAWANL